MEPCPVYKKCGGCQLQNLPYERQLQWKQARCQKLLGAFGQVRPIIGMEHPWHYRNKVQAAFAWDKRRSRAISGVYQSSTHRIVPVDSCQIEDEKADEIICTIRGMLKSFKLAPYDEDTGRGFLRHVLVKRGFGTGEIMVVLVTGTPVFPAKKHFLSELLERHPEITTVIQNINSMRTSLVLGRQEKVLYGPGFIVDELCGCRFRISAKSFYQVNPLQTQVLYRQAMEFAGLTGKERVLDAYCGIGTIGLIAAKSGAGQVLGVEVNKDAVRDAIVNAKENQVKNIYFTCADAGGFMKEMAARKEPCGVVFMDPPRAGASPAFLKALCALAPRRVVYISCNPETLARDLKLLQGQYRVQALQPVDMFPHTQHVETIVLLRDQRSTRDYVYVDYAPESSEYMEKMPPRATYPEIKAWVRENHGLKVSSLYISQVKRKHGLPVGENYNKPKDEGAKQPQCPPEKAAAIEAALRHFRLIP